MKQPWQLTTPKTSPLHLISIMVQMVRELLFIAWAYQVLVYRVV